MKLVRLNLKHFLRFKNLDLNFTYPEDHPTKAGLPMDKVCFIGQSGTGKTNILRVIHYLLADVIEDARKEGKKGFYNDYYKGSYLHLMEKDEIEFELYFNELSDTYTGYCTISGEKKENTCNCTFKLKSSNQTCDETLNKFIEFRESSPERTMALIHFEAERSLNPNFFNSYLSDSDNNNPQSQFIAYLDQYHSDLLANAVSEKYRKHLAKDLEFKQRISNMAVELSINGSNSNESEGALSKLIEEYKGWKEQNPSPIEQFAVNHLNPVLKLFGLKVRTLLDAETFQNLQALHLEQLDGTYLPNDGWSLGTRNLVFAALPLYMLNAQKAVILMDEPETSLYPDVQKKLVHLYTDQLNKDNDNQYFFATHSPMFAAEFEPCERFIFYFDEEGEINVKKGSAAEGNVPDQLLEKDFTIPLLGEAGLIKWRRLNEIVQELYHLSMSPNNSEERKKLTKEYLQIAHTYNFPVPGELK